MDDVVTVVDLIFIGFLTFELWLLDKLKTNERTKRDDSEFDYKIQRRDGRKFYWSRRIVGGRSENGQRDNFSPTTPTPRRLSLE
jgi:hypothetical protein